jgi:FAD-dependent oxidoreductase domain-containing protein 1
MQRSIKRGDHSVAIVGGGAMGSSVAYHLETDRNFTGDVVVIERDPTCARASSALSASSIRQQFSTPRSCVIEVSGRTS